MTPMVLYDQHLHSRHSMDSKTAPADNVEAAIRRGLAGLTFTEHFDTHPDDWPGCVYDDAAYSAAIEELRERYAAQIFVGKGIEVCYQPANLDFILDFLSAHRFDVVLLSIHYFAGRSLHRREHWTGLDVFEGTRRYLQDVLAAVHKCVELRRAGPRPFDVLAHLDVVKRYSQRFGGSTAVESFGSLIDEILAACLEAELVPEINTSSLRQGLTETMPGPTIVEQYARRGGTGMSIGSDAHRSEDVGAGFDVACDMMRNAGLRHLVFFEQRRRIDIRIDTTSDRRAPVQVPAVSPSSTFWLDGPELPRAGRPVENPTPPSADRRSTRPGGVER